MTSTPPQTQPTVANAQRWGLPWSGADPEFTRTTGSGTPASPGLQEVMPVRRHRQQAVHETLEKLTDAGFAEVRVLQCLRVLLNEEWEHHRYTVRDLDILDPAGARVPDDPHGAHRDDRGAANSRP